MSYSVCLFGNRKGAIIDADYIVCELESYELARRQKAINGGWGCIKEHANYQDALKSNNDFMLEILGQGLNIKRAYVGIGEALA